MLPDLGEAPGIHGRSILGLLLDRQIRATIDAGSDKIGAKIRLAQLEKVPYMLVLGAREEQAGEIAVRSRKNGDEGALKSVGVCRFESQMESQGNVNA